LEQKKDSGEFVYNFFFVLFKRKWSILAVFITTFIGIIFGTYLITPLWKATAKVQVDMNPKQQLSLFKNMTTPAEMSPRVDPANNLIQLLTSRETAEKIVITFHRDEMLRKRKENPEHSRDKIKADLKEILIDSLINFLTRMGVLTPKPENYLADAVKELRKDLEDIKLEEGSGIITVSIWAEDTKLATDMTNTMVSLLIETDLQLTLAPFERLYNFTKKEFVRVENDIRQFEDAIKEYKVKNKIVLLDTQKKALVDRLTGFENDLIQVGSDQNEIEKRINKLNTQLAQQDPERITVKKDMENISSTNLGDNPQLLELKSLLRDRKSKLAALFIDKTLEHPDAKLLQAEIDLFNEELKNEIEKLVRSETKQEKSVHSETMSLNPIFLDLVSKLNDLQLDKHALTAQKSSTIKAIKDAEKEMLSLPEKELHLARLEDQLRIKQKIYNELKNNLDQLNVMRNSPQSDFNLKIIDKAMVYDNVPPDWPKWTLNISAGFLTSFILGVGFAFFLEYWDSSFKSVKELEEILKLPVLGAIPRY
jgi:uncharacterized protein involved in exopolysaccharide biosynthesis